MPLHRFSLLLISVYSLRLPKPAPLLLLLIFRLLGLWVSYVILHPAVPRAIVNKGLGHMALILDAVESPVALVSSMSIVPGDLVDSRDIFASFFHLHGNSFEVGEALWSKRDLVELVSQVCEAVQGEATVHELMQMGLQGPLVGFTRVFFIEIEVL